MAEKDRNSGLSRRGVLEAGAGLVAFSSLAEAAAAAPKGPRPRTLSWLGAETPATETGITWGMPWSRGTLAPNTPLTLSAGGKSVPLQSWPLAYWPDGTLKWTGHAIAAPLPAGALTLAPGHSVPPKDPVRVHETTETILIKSGPLRVLLNRRGGSLIDRVDWQGRTLLTDGRLIACREDRSRASEGIRRTEEYVGEITRLTVEQSGPVRALVRIDGLHQGGGRRWLPFTLRLAVFAGSPTLKLVHSFVFDGDQAQDYLSGLGVRCDVPLTDEPQNRHIRFAGEGEGMWGEAVRNLPGWRPEKFAYAARMADQLQGKPVPALADMDEKSRAQLLSVAAWNDFKLMQESPDHFSVRKRTHERACWLDAGYGHRASGLAYVGGVSGGLAFGVRDFWQRVPTALEITGALGAKASATVWLWSPDAPAMDLRHYDDVSHGLEISYEGTHPETSTPLGIARTSEILLRVCPATPPRAEFAALAETLREPPLLTASPGDLHQSGVFGIWSLPDRTTPVKARLEDELTGLIDFYLKEVDRRHWYGFWNYGDIRHSYDNDRHDWRYDVGGYAWDNSELVPDIWLWYTFLRSGRRDVFRMAEAMTRHTGEVDVYHLGPYRTLGSRHNVSHWGDGAKEARISQALLRRFYYYLTADERTGDLMAELADGEVGLAHLDPLRSIEPKTQYPTHARTGPDWLALAGNWFVAWERSNDPKWRDKILVGMNDIAAMKYGMFSGTPLGFDPQSGHLYDLGQEFKGSYHLSCIFGGAELMFEMLPLVDAPAFGKSWLRFCAYYNAPEAERRRDIDPRATDKHFVYSTWYARLTAYAAWRNADPVLAQRAWQELLYGQGQLTSGRYPFAQVKAEPPDALRETVEMPWLGGSNHAAQWSLNLIELLALAGGFPPATLNGIWQRSA